MGLATVALGVVVYPATAHAAGLGGGACQPDGVSLATVLAGAFSASIGAWQAGDVAQPHPLPDGRVLWLLNDSFVDPAAPAGPITTTSTFLHNVAIIQNGRCFDTITEGLKDSVSLCN